MQGTVPRARAAARARACAARLGHGRLQVLVPRQPEHVDALLLAVRQARADKTLLSLVTDCGFVSKLYFGRFQYGVLLQYRRLTLIVPERLLAI
ncbi:hypothetical protein O3G_MSEX002472 [Manduca sexta]|uniref:Uncharacterized protein n=1 Tax=Manduca sexta TaxID=7130 RepID=A0A921YP42_MANSE|nr:hypothetical protein O3G_MSEX002472 [Manduca sexta]